MWRIDDSLLKDEKKRKKTKRMNGKIGDCRNFLLPPSKEATIASFQLVDAIRVMVHLREEGLAG